VQISSLLTDWICVSWVTTIDGYAVRLSDIEVGAVVVHVVVVADEGLHSDIPLGRQPGACCARGGRVKCARRLPTLDAQWLIGGEVALATYPGIHSQDRSLVRTDLSAETVTSFT